MIGLVFVLVAAGGLFWLAYRRPRPRRWWLPRPAAARPAVSAVDRQHRHLQAGGLLGEAAFEHAKARFRELLAAGRAAEVEGELRPGLEFAVRVRALAEVGTPEAGRVLARQLSRTLARDPVEQAWYWADLAAGLRRVGATEALPAVLRCAAAAEGLAQEAVLSAEAVAFPNFPAALHDPSARTGRLALRALARAARGCRDGVIDPAGMVRAGIGDHLAAVCETARPVPDPWLAAAVLEAARVARRLDHWSRLPAADVESLARRQALRLRACADRRGEWLADAPRRLVARFPSADAEEQRAALAVLNELRADISPLFPHPPDRRSLWWAEAVRCLAWAKSRSVGPALADRAARLLRSRRGASAAAILLGALRGHRTPEAEAVLLRAAGSLAPAVRKAAFGAVGWWEPFDPLAVMRALNPGRVDPDPAVRRAAVAALARLGERAALQEFAEAFAAEEPAIRRAAARTAADEGLTWLWPELDALAAGPPPKERRGGTSSVRFAPSADPETALAAAEAVERLREQILGPLG